jgi:heme a synthase
MAQSLRSTSLSAFRGLHAPNVEARILTNFRQSFKAAGFATSRPVISQGLGAEGFFFKKPLLSRISGLKSFGPRFSSSKVSGPAGTDLPILSTPAVGFWLLGSSALVYAIIVVGGITRLTESGLSITEWRPVTGILPPLSKAEWEAEFDKYKLTPEFKLYVYARKLYLLLMRL